MITGVEFYSRPTTTVKGGADLRKGCGNLSVLILVQHECCHNPEPHEQKIANEGVIPILNFHHRIFCFNCRSTKLIFTKRFVLLRHRHHSAIGVLLCFEPDSFTSINEITVSCDHAHKSKKRIHCGKFLAVLGGRGCNWTA